MKTILNYLSLIIKETTKIAGGTILALVILFVFLNNNGYSVGVSEYYANNIADEYVSDPIVQFTIRMCEGASDYSKVRCVNDIHRKLFTYTERNTTFDYHPATKMLLNGSLCRDSTIYYCSVFRAMNISCRYEHIKMNETNHAFNIVWGDDFYCRVDQNMVDCEKW